MFRLRAIGTALLVIAIVLITLKSVNNSYATSVISGKKAYNTQSIGQRFNLWLLSARADLGDSTAQINYGIIMLQHSKSPAVMKPVLASWRELAKQGSARALYLLALATISGAPGLKPDESKGMAFLKASAKKGFKPAKELLAKLDQPSGSMN